MMDEMGRLRDALNARGIAWRDLSVHGKSRTLYPSEKGIVAVICGAETYGGSIGLLEAWYPGEPHAGWLIAEDVIANYTPMRRHTGGLI